MPCLCPHSKQAQPQNIPTIRGACLIGYGKDSKTYQCYHRATHKVVESYHIVFIESKDKGEVVFRPGVTQGLDDKTITSDSLQLTVKETPTVTPNPTSGVSPTTQTPPTIAPPTLPTVENLLERAIASM